MAFDWQDRIVLIFIYIGFFLPLSIWIVKGFFDAIPRELDDIAKVDGYSYGRYFARILLPQIAPGIATPPYEASQNAPSAPRCFPRFPQKSSSTDQ